ncbi:MAG: 16S rRNA (adenine(1518)-N(6)/adenine(1519)-N(6))-dimethyltransferase RsmA, partial [Betaproteobacteria bacterium]
MSRRPPPSRTVDGHVARKRYGQNFLADSHYVARIANAVAPKPGETVVEIGPGLGALAGELIARAGRIVAVEIDRDLAARLRERFAPGVRELVVGDALAFDFASLGANLRVVGNLPYNISSPILFHLAAQAHALHDLTVMLQREVVARMTAAPATAEYGRLTVMLQATFAIERLFTVPAGAFRPAPKVESAVARLVPLGDARPRI